MDPKALKIASTLPWRIALQLQSRDRLDKMIHRVRNSLGCQALLAFSVSSSFRPLHTPKEYWSGASLSVWVNYLAWFWKIVKFDLVCCSQCEIHPLAVSIFSLRWLRNHQFDNKACTSARWPCIPLTLLIRIFRQPDLNFKHEECASLAPPKCLHDVLIWRWSFRRCMGVFAGQ